MEPIRGIDSSIPIRTAAEALALAQAGRKFVCRYYATPKSKKKLLSAEETKLITQAGMSIVTVVEDVNGKVDDFSAGEATDQAEAALACAKNALQPPGSAIYFAVDYDANAGDMDTIKAYFKIVNKMFGGKYKIGVYGSGYVCHTLGAAGLIEYKWLSGSWGWRDSLHYTEWHIKQTIHQSGDTDVAQFEDYGGWTIK